MLRYFLKRLAALVPLVLLVSLICFALMQATPGGPSSVLSDNPMMTPTDAAQTRSNFGFDQPVLVQFGLWLKRVALHGDFGRSHVTGEPVLDMIKQRLPATLELMGVDFRHAHKLTKVAGAHSAAPAVNKQFTSITLSGINDLRKTRAYQSESSFDGFMLSLLFVIGSYGNALSIIQ